MDYSPVFVVGCGHSGTTLVLRTLSRVPGFWAPAFETNWATYPAAEAQERLSKLCQEAADHQSRLVEKSPMHVFFIDKIYTLCPSARVIVVVSSIMGNRIESYLFVNSDLFL